jgi:hypothetical protein
MANEGTTPRTEEEVTAASLSTTGKSPKDLENTVLLGRGKSHLNHQGNKFFQGETGSPIEIAPLLSSIFFDHSTDE